MTVEDASLAVQTNYEASDGAHAPHFDASQHSQASGSFQVPDSDDHELLEQLAERQEQEYWSMMGDECTAGSLHSSSSASSVGRACIA